MIFILCGWLNTGIFLCSSAIHFYWAAGGNWKHGQSIPHSNKEVALFHPGKLATSLVATGLLLFALLSLCSIGLFKGVISSAICLYGNALIGTLFLARALDRKSTRLNS